jgi:hypothetical protein
MAGNLLGFYESRAVDVSSTFTGSWIVPPPDCDSIMAMINVPSTAAAQLEYTNASTLDGTSLFVAGTSSTGGTTVSAQIPVPCSGIRIHCTVAKAATNAIVQLCFRREQPAQ